MKLRLAHMPSVCALVSVAGLWFLAGCSSGGSGGNSSPTPVAPTIATQPSAQTAFIGDTATFTVVASGTPAPTYQWQKAGTAISGATGSSYTTPALAATDDGSLFTVIASNSAGTVTSSAAKLSVAVKPAAIITQPADISINDGASATFAVVATGTAPVSFQWLKNGVAISGATSTSYTFSPAQIADTGTLFSVKVSNSLATVTSNTAKLTVNALAPAIAVQPAGATQFVGETATFGVTASGTAPTYQWRKNSAAISGATSATYTTPTLAAGDDNSTYDVIVSNAAGSLTSSAATLRVGPFATTYTTQKGVKLNLYAWPGSKNAFLTKTNTLNPVIMRKILAAADGTWNYYADAVGKLPSFALTYNGLATIANTGVGGVDLCGDGCTYIGATGMELSDSIFAALYNNVPNGLYDQSMFYEFGRSFWLFNNQIAYKSPTDSSCEVTGFAVLMRYRSISAQGFTGYFNGSAAGYTSLYNNTLPLIDTYAGNTSLTFNNTFLTNSFSSPYGGCADLWTSMVLRLAQNYGGEAFIQALFKEVLKRPSATTTQDAIDNFVLAASAAANKNLTLTFGTTWRWPVSAAALAEATSKWGAADVLITPSSASLLLGQTVQFSATGSPATWAVNGVAGGSSTLGTISNTGLFTAPSVLPAVGIQVSASAAGGTATAAVAVQSDVSVTLDASSATDPILTQSTLTLTPTILSAGAPNKSVTWTVNGVANGNSGLGAITTSGTGTTYTAPASQPTTAVTITATSVADTSRSASLVRHVQGIALSATTGAPGTAITVSGHFDQSTTLMVRFLSGSYDRSYALTPSSSTTATVYLPMFQTSDGTITQGTVTLSCSQGNAVLGSVDGFVIMDLPVATGSLGDVTVAVLKHLVESAGNASNSIGIVGSSSSGTVDAATLAGTQASIKKLTEALLLAVQKVRANGGTTTLATVNGTTLAMNPTTVAMLDRYFQAYLVNSGATSSAIAMLPAETRSALGILGGSMTAEQRLQAFSVLPNSVFTYLIHSTATGLAAAAVLTAAGVTVPVEVAGILIVGIAVAHADIAVEDLIGPMMDAVLRGILPTSAEAAEIKNDITLSQGIFAQQGLTLSPTLQTFQSATATLAKEMDTTNTTSTISLIIENEASIAAHAPPVPQNTSFATMDGVMVQQFDDRTTQLDLTMRNLPPGMYNMTTSWGDTYSFTLGKNTAGIAYTWFDVPAGQQYSCFVGTVTLKDSTGAQLATTSGCWGYVSGMYLYWQTGSGATACLRDVSINGTSLLPGGASTCYAAVTTKVCNVAGDAAITVGWTLSGTDTILLGGGNFQGISENLTALTGITGSSTFATKPECHQTVNGMLYCSLGPSFPACSTVPGLTHTTDVGPVIP